jgi:hypothetical protein
MQHIIAITGEKRHGKSTIAQTLFDLGFETVNFADPVRAVAHLVFGITYEEMENDDLKEMPLDRFPFISPREIMQQIGTDLFRDWIDDTWIEAWKRAIPDKLAVVTGDLRFPNEADSVRALGGYVVRVVNPNKPSGTDQHISESGQDRVTPDFTIINDGTIEELRAKALDFGRFVLAQD